MSLRQRSLLKAIIYTVITLTAVQISRRAYGSPEMSSTQMMPPYFNEQHAFSKLHSLNLMEISYARITLTKSREPEVLSTAQLMIEEHTTNDEELASYASSVQIPVREFTPYTDSEAADQVADQQILTKLINATPADYDVTYVDENMGAQKRTDDWLSVAVNGLNAKDRDFILAQKAKIERRYQAFLQLRDRLRKPGA